jgi:hypothetical protein
LERPRRPPSRASQASRRRMSDALPRCGVATSPFLLPSVDAIGRLKRPAYLSPRFSASLSRSSSRCGIMILRTRASLPEARSGIVNLARNSLAVSPLSWIDRRSRRSCARPTSNWPMSLDHRGP